MSTVARFHASSSFESPRGVGSHGVETSIPLSRSQTLRGIANRQPQKRAWRTFRHLAAAALAAGTIVALTQPWKRFSAEPVATTSRHDAVRTVQVDRPARASTAGVVMPATIRPWQTTTLHARVSGYLTAWHKDLGARVKAGELLAEIETPELDQELAEGQALAAEAVAQAVQARAEREEAAADLKVAEAQLTRARAEAELTKMQLVRREELLAKKAVALEEFQVFQNQLVVRAADVASAEADVARRHTNLETRAAIIDAREATAKSRQSNVDRLKELQVFKRIVAPFDGVVTYRGTEVGMLVTAGKESLFVVQDMSRVRVQMNVPQAYSAQTSRGVAATISVPESTAQAVLGTITRVADSVDSANRTMLAEIELENSTGRFQPGSYAQVALTVPQDKSAWTVPTNTVQMKVEGPHLAIVNDDGQVEIRRVRLGRDLGNRVVAIGIRGDERLIVNPSDDLVDGARVEVGNHELSTKIAQR